MSNPYGGGYQPYQPDDSPTGEPYGSPYDSPYAAPTAPLDGLSIAALVSSATCCGAPVGIGLGIAGLVRTGGGRRRGRWAAVTGLVLGIVVSLAGVAFLVFAGWQGSRTVFEDEARVGQCVDIDGTFDDLTKAECDEPHDAEVIWVEKFDDDLVDEWADSPHHRAFCTARDLEPGYSSLARSEEYDVEYSTDAFPDDEPEAGDWFVCLLTPREGRLEESLRQRGSSGA